MFKCRECGCEFENKPDYCDCGNDSFEQIITEEKYDDTAVQTKPYVSESILKKNLPSIIFLIFCIILSFIILFFIGNPKDEPQKKIENKKEEKLNIPDIDKIWNDEKPKQQVIQKPKVEPIIKISEPKIDKIEQKKEPTKVNKQTPQNKPSAPVIQKNKQTQTVVQKTTVQPQAQKSTPQNSTQAKPTQTKPVQTQQVQTQKPVQVQPQTQKPQQNTASNIQTTPSAQSNPEELKQYKKALRNKIASNIDFLSVAGDGKCSLSFNVSSSGALLNRKFVSQSQNISLNDAVYQAMLQVATFKAPPAGYKNETLKLTVQISGGNFSVSLE